MKIYTVIVNSFNRFVGEQNNVKYAFFSKKDAEYYLEIQKQLHEEENNKKDVDYQTEYNYEIQTLELCEKQKWLYELEVDYGKASVNGILEKIHNVKIMGEE